MDLIRNGTLHPHLRDSEALVVENAIRLAIDSIINVLFGVNSARTHEHQRMVADRDKEIQRLECRLKEIEHELQVLRRQGCTCRMVEKQAASHSLAGPQSCDDPQKGEQGTFGPNCSDTEMTAGHQECDMNISLGLYARPPSHVSSQSHESALPSSPSRMGLDQSCAFHSSESSGLSEAAVNLPTSPSSLVVKQEPCDIDTVLIKWEMSEDRFEEHRESTSPCQDKESPGVKKKLETKERIKFRDKPHTDPDGRRVTEEQHLRGRGISVFTPHMKRCTEGTPHLQKHIIESMESCGMKPQNAAPTQPQREIRQDSRSKRKRCAICPAAKDRKASSSCSQCTRPVCKEHRHEVVICDACKHLDGHLLYTHDWM